MHRIALLLLSLFFLIGTFSLTAMISSLRKLQKGDAKKRLKSSGKLFFYRPFHLLFFPKREYEGIFFAAITAQSITRFCFAAFSMLLFIGMPSTQALINTTLFTTTDTGLIWTLFYWISLLIMAFTVGDFLPRILGTRLPDSTLRVTAPLASLFLFLTFPITYIFFRLTQSLSRDLFIDYLHEPSAQAKQEIIQLIHEARLGPSIDSHDKKLIESVLTFRDRIAREVMVPRVDLFSLSADTTIKEAAIKLRSEGYSRTPVYRNTVDNIVGVLMYKDILNKYMEAQQKGNPKILEAPIESIQKSALYTPETKKLSALLQEFRKKQVHLAIVVDEYGGTEGIVTIEDILEEIVGEIADEYDKEKALFRSLPDGTWIVDARMNILDVEEQLDITIPQDGDYDTLGGYIYHVAGAIPTKGFKIHHNDFEIEVLKSNERAVEQVRIKPLALEDEETGDEGRNS